MNAGEPAHQRVAEARLKLAEATAVHQSRNDLAHVIGFAEASGQDAVDLVRGIQRLFDGEDIFETLAAPSRSRDLSMDFETALTKLPDGAREIFVLHDVEGYKHHEIATLLEISAGTSKAQLHRARMMLRRHLRPEGT